MADSDAPRILVFTPRLRLHGRSVAAAHAMFRAYGGPVEWLQIENDQPRGACGPGHDGNQNVLHNYRIGRARMLAGDYTHMLCLEDDMVPPPDAIDTLLAVGASVAYGLYCWRRPPYHWSAYKTIHEMDGVSISDDNPWQAQQRAQAGAIIPVAGVGLGCTLIDRTTAEAVPWRCPEGVGGANDWYFALDCQARGLRQAAHLGVRCGHIADSPSLRIIWPDPDADGHAVACKRLHRFEYLEASQP
jgi:hypothetical protein